jgi:beta-galactosidase
MYYGVDYYPEHLPEERWGEDARLMKEAGLNVVRMGEFAWSLFEPRDGVYEFEWMDRAIYVLDQQGIDVVLSTPSAAPPPWLSQSYPEAIMVDANGHKLSTGGRRFTCPTSPIYRRLSIRIAQQLAEHYSHNPAVIGWQIDNELSYGASPRCYCENCRDSFRGWLRGKYGSLGKLNESWGTSFWSQTYTSWTQIPVPLPSGADHNPGLLLDYMRFQSDAYVTFLCEQVAVIRQICPHTFVTHNVSIPFMDTINNMDLAKHLDFLSEDTYPGFWRIMPYNNPPEGSRADLFKPENIAMLSAWGYDAIRGQKNGDSFWVMEQQSGPSGQKIFSPAPRPNQLRLWVYQALARGARAITHFRWESCTFGAEEYWHGILDHDLVPRRRYAR